MSRKIDKKNIKLLKELEKKLNAEIKQVKKDGSLQNNKPNR